MCGLLGQFTFRSPVDQTAFRAANNSMAHRGPDAEAVVFLKDGQLALGHRRLAIIDLDARSNQPFHDPKSGRVLVYNGEIYNFRALRSQLEDSGYRFTTTSDTEVLLAAYDKFGPHCVTRFEGMFAFALFDPSEDTLVLARDHSGQKPLYYRHDATGFAFASELKALLALPGMPRTMSAQGLNAYLAYGYVSDPDCILQGYAKLSPGEILRFDLSTGTLSTDVFWTPPDFTPAETRADTLVEALHNLLAEGISRQLVADVPVAVLLSGGLDSSLVAAIAAQNGRQIHTFTVVFPEDQAFDESVHARRVAHHVGATHKEVVADEPDADVFDRVVAQFCEPIADNSIFPTFLVSRALRETATVALGGDGGDELFGGYPQYRNAISMGQFDRFVPRIAQNLVPFVPDGLRGANRIRAALSKEMRAAFFNRYLSPALRNDLLRPRDALVLNDDPEQDRQAMWRDDFSTPQNLTRMDMRHYLPNNILHKTDRAAMAVGLETRAPFLDPAIMNFAFRDVPDSLKADRKNGKILMQMLAKKILPEDFDTRRKQGFSSPLHRWLKGPWAGIVRDSTENMKAQGLIDATVVDTMTRKISAQNPLISRQVLQLVLLDRWMREFRIGF